MRPCPLCNSENRIPVYKALVMCDCGLPYDSNPVTTDYRNESKYASENATGSGCDADEQKRHQGTVDILYGLPGKILDIGCAGGGLAVAFKEAGREVIGMDPSPECVRITREKGIEATVGAIGDVQGRYDIITLSHVLEHLADPVAALRKLGNHCSYLYVEVPNAERYSDDIHEPYIHFSTEHIQHFSMGHLEHAARLAGFDVAGKGYRHPKESCHGAERMRYSAIWVLLCPARHKSYSMRWKMEQYVLGSAALAAKMDSELREKLAGRKEVILWGAGQFSRTLMDFPVMRKVEVTGVVDHNPSLHGTHFHDVVVRPVGSIPASGSVPIIAGSILNKASIVAEARERGLSHRLITLGETP